MSPELIEEILRTVGVGGVLAFAVFQFYRKDAKQWLHRHVELTARLEKAFEGQQQIIVDNTKAMTRVAERLDNIVGVSFDKGA